MTPKWKQRLFWVTFVPICVTIVMFDLLCWIPYLVLEFNEWLNEKIGCYEGWCFKESREENGMYYQGGGIWSNRKP